MHDTLKSIFQTLSENAEENFIKNKNAEDYLAEDGLWHCGKCGTAKQFRLPERFMKMRMPEIVGCYAVFALLDIGELVNVGNFDDLDTAEISQIILDIFTEDKKAVFDVNLEVFGIKKFLEMLRYVSADSETLYQTLVSDLKRQLKSGELDVSFT